MDKKMLKPDDAEFFALVSAAAFTNPFSRKRVEIDRKITNAPADASWVQVRPEAIREVARRIEKLDRSGPCKVQDFRKADRDLVKYLFLFDVYHKFNQDFDQLIADQIAAGPQPVKVPFAGRALAELTKRGFSQDLASRYFSLFYQIRRAFYFIERSLIGKCPSMRRLREDLWNNIFTHDIRHFEMYLWDKMEDFSTILSGPTGCGKGAAAAAVGRSGFIPFDEKKGTFAKSFTETFIPINLSQYAETLLESELFGHAKGAFTGAIGAHDGLLSLCGRHGSIFLDEIGEISMQIQIKLLGVLQDRYFSPVGSHTKLRFQGRVIAATNKSIDRLRREGKFRDDFYYRLCSDCIDVPGLQQRIGENPNELNELIAHTVKVITQTESQELIGSIKEVIAKNLGKDYHWPGNVRELAQCVRRVIIKQDYRGDIAAGGEDMQSRLLAEVAAGALSAQEMLAAYCNLLYQRCGTYEQVARKTGLDRRTVKKYIQSSREEA